MDLLEKVRFDGGEKETIQNKDWYINRCKGNAINLRLFNLGYYNQCEGCRYQDLCKHVLLDIYSLLSPPKGEKVRFDGGEMRTCEEQYVEKCNGGGKNLHLFRLGNYLECNSCIYQKVCKESARISREQTEP